VEHTTEMRITCINFTKKAANLLFSLAGSDGFSTDDERFFLPAAAFVATEASVPCLPSFFSFSRLLALVAEDMSGSKFFAPLLRTPILLPANYRHKQQKLVVELISE